MARPLFFARASAGPWVLAGSLAVAVTVAPAAPAAGRYEGRFCVTTGAGSADCGPATVELRRAGLAHVRISDVMYALTLHSSQVDVVLKHGAMQIDGFTGPYEWRGDGKNTALHFADPAKSVLYEVRLGERLRQSR